MVLLGRKKEIMTGGHNEVGFRITENYLLFSLVMVTRMSTVEQTTELYILFVNL